MDCFYFSFILIPWGLLTTQPQPLRVDLFHLNELKLFLKFKICDIRNLRFFLLLAIDQIHWFYFSEFLEPIFHLFFLKIFWNICCINFIAISPHVGPGGLLLFWQKTNLRPLSRTNIFMDNLIFLFNDPIFLPNYFILFLNFIFQLLDSFWKGSFITRRELLYNYHITLYFNNNPQKGVVI